MLHKIAKLMGHTDLRSTQRYAHLMPNALDGVVDNLHMPDEWRPLSVVNPHKQPTLVVVGDEEVAAAG